jgi:hypothetical protein
VALNQLKTVAIKAFESNDPYDQTGSVLSNRGERAIEGIASSDQIAPAAKLIRRRVTRLAFGDIVGQVLQILVGGFEVPHDENEAAQWNFRYGRMLGVLPGSHKREIADDALIEITPNELLGMLSKFSVHIPMILKADTAILSNPEKLRSVAREIALLVKQSFPQSAPPLDVKLIPTNVATLGMRIFSDFVPEKQAIAALLWMNAREIPEVMEGLRRLTI